MAHLTVTMTTTPRRRLSQEQIEALIELRVAELRVLAAQAVIDYGREREHERDERIRRLPLPRGRSWACVADRWNGTRGIPRPAGRESESTSFSCSRCAPSASSAASSSQRQFVTTSSHIVATVSKF
jgi:hypothetical protein